jgi:hypothetical protein
VGRASLIDPDWLSKVKRHEEHLILTKFPHDPADISRKLVLPPRMVDYLLSRPKWLPREGA